jgi:predicted MFS family arabinose efflux permease
MTVQITSYGRRVAFGLNLLLIMSVATFLHFAISVLSPFLAEEFTLSAVQLGILGTTNNGVAALGAPFVGAVVDALGGRRIAILLIALSGASIIGFALAPSYLWLVAMTAINGLAAAGSNPATNHLVSTHIPPGRRGMITGVKQSGVRAGQFLAGLLLPIGALAVGWRQAMVVTGIICLVAIGGVFATIPPTIRDRTRRVGPPGQRVRLEPMVWRLAAYSVLMGTGMSALLLYLPLYSVQRLDMSVQSAGLTIGVIGFVGIFARIASGPMAERFPSASIPLLIMAVGSVVGGAAIWAAEETSVILIWVGVVMMSLTGAVWNTVANYAIISGSHQSRTGQASGVLHTAYLAGLAIGPIVSGTVIDRSNSYGLAWFGVCASFGLAAVVTVRWWLVERGQTRLQAPA